VFTRLIDLIDRAVIGGLVLLILLTPFCFGTVHPWAYHTAETVIFAMLGAAFLRMRVAKPAIKGASEVLSIAAPAALVVLLIGVQLLPLPASLLRILSPQTYNFYQHALNGWPKSIDYPVPQARPTQSVDSGTEPVLLPTESEVRNGAPVPFTSSSESGGVTAPPVVGRLPATPGWYGSTWRSLSLAPPLGMASGLQLLAAFCLFVIVALYPVTPEATAHDDDPLTRLLVAVILISGFAVAVVALVQQVTWNGKLLWFFVPLDWRVPNLNRPRMTGPFVNPDHFAAYLAMTVPLFVARAFGAIANGRRERDGTVPILCSAALVVLVCAILLSESRAIWAGLLLAGVLFAVLVSRTKTPTAFRSPGRAARVWLIRFGIAGLVVAVLAIALIGTAGRGEVDTRIGQSAAGGLGFWYRVQIWRDTLRMVRHYPILGVGFGSWAEVFPHYQSGPWPPMFLRNAHNDYIEAAAELGILGVAAFVMLGGQIARVIRKRWQFISPHAQLTLAALVAGLAVEGFHELFDFSLTTPAIGFLFTIYAALAVRIAVAGSAETERAIRARRWVRGAAPYAAMGAMILAIASRLQARVLFPYYPPAKTFEDARTMVLLHPANAGTHLALASWYGDSRTGIAEVARAVWIDPRNPYARDLYAHRLEENGRFAESLNQVTLSVTRAPNSGSHFYLNPRIVPYLTTSDRRAIKQGLVEAMARGYSEAIDSLGAFYLNTGRTLDAARVYERGAASEQDPHHREQLLMIAGQTYARAAKLDRARSCFDEARGVRPDDPQPYSLLLTEVFVRQKNVADAENTLKEGLDAGVDPTPLFAAFAQVATAAGQTEKARAALVKMVEYDPTYDNLLRLGSFYAAAHEYTRAWFELANAEDAAYQYAAADRDYSRASGLDPANLEIQSRYTAFKQKLAAVRTGGTPGSASADDSLSN
jgi:O-antigen ligase/tetratricopeptide (TPR) repeat protein